MKEVKPLNFGDNVPSSTPLPITLKKPDNPTFVDLTGRKKGTLTVIGVSYSTLGSSGKGLRWVVQCDCGSYEIRTTKSINKTLTYDACGICKNHQKN